MSFSIFNEVLTHVTLISVLILILLIIRQYVIQYIGVKAMYFIWGILPLSLLITALPFPWLHINLAEPVKVLVVSTSSTVRAYSSNELWQNVWIFGVALLGLSTVAQYLHSLRHLKLIPVDKPLSSLQHMQVNCLLFYSERIKSPILCGIVEPKLVLPIDFECSLTRQQQQLVIEHEICHLQRRDNIWNLIAFIIVLCFWFNPLIWLAYKYFRRDQELSCDAQVLANKSELKRIEYSKALLAVAINEHRLPYGALAFKQLTAQQQLVERIIHIKNKNTPTQLAASLLMLLVVGTLLSLSFIGKMYSEHRIENDFKLNLVSRVTPKYPLKAAEQRIEGFVKLAFDVDENGFVSDIKVLESSPKNTFEQNAKYALSQWRYKSVGFGVKNQHLQMDFVMDE